jgi:diguanylate cyclase (GGDEF)-like protein
MFNNLFKKEKVLTEIDSHGTFEMIYRLVINNTPMYVSLKAAKIMEDGSEYMIVGVRNIDARIRREQEYKFNLMEAQHKANIDSLTRVKNKHAYVDIESELNEMIANNIPVEFAIVIFDINGLKTINDTHGHQTGDNFIKAGCQVICDIFKHSSVFRVGGDEFAVIVQGRDYKNLDKLLAKCEKHNLEAIKRTHNFESETNNGTIYNFESKEIVIAVGSAKYEGDRSVAAVFDRADLEMYKNKNELKEIKKEPID